MSLAKPPHCHGCFGWSWGSSGYVPASGSGTSGVLVVAEAAGEHEAQDGLPLIGKAGHYLWSQLARAGIDREGFRIHNCLSCRPPKNVLAGASYEQDVVTYCAPLLDATIAGMQQKVKQYGKHLVILTLGKIAFKRIMGIGDKNPIFKYDYLGYPLWSDRYNCWVMAAEHPSFLMRGQHSRVPILQFIFKRALEIAEQGLKLDDSEYLEDPAPERFLEWVKACLHYLHENPEAILSYDIETPHKQGQDEEEAAKEDDGDYTILRCSFSYAPGIAVSVPWIAPYIPMIESLFASPHEKCSWNGYQYDDPRIRTQMPINGDLLDGMIMWHVLNSALDKGLGFVTPWYVHNTSMWKHLSDERPAYYNAKDADMALRNVLGIRKDLKANDLWKVYENHVVKLNRALSYMSEMGVLRDEEMRNAAEEKLSNILNKITYDMAAVVPDAARRLKIYKKLPKELKGLDGIELEEAAKALNMVQVERSMPVKRCSLCGMPNPSKSHFKPATKKQLAGGLDKVCAEAAIITAEEIVKVWAKQLDFRVSKLGLSMYQEVVQHRAIVDWKEKKVTFDAKAIARLVKQYPNDSLYPLILKHREVQKLLGTYIGITQLDGKIKGGMDIALDGRIHTCFTHNPSTLRLASQHPNLQNCPRPTGKDDLATIIRNLIIAGPGQIFLARDYCVGPNTKILKSDLTWERAEAIKVGDELIGFDEDLSSHRGVGKGHRSKNKLRKSIVLAINRLIRPRIIVHTTKGSIIVSDEHKFIARYPKHRRTWTKASELEPGMLLPFFGPPWDTDSSREGGYLAGFLDGGGWCHRTNLGFGQNEGPALAHVLELLQKKQYKVSQYGRGKKHKDKLQFQYACIGGIGNQLHLLGSIRPQRLLAGSTSMWEDRQIYGKCSDLAIVSSIEHIEAGEVIAIKTSTGTFISDGYFSHNCGIEAVLVGYFALSPRYIRLAKIDIHSYYTAYALHELDGRVSANDLPLVSWDDAKLTNHLAAIKAEFKAERNNLYKHLIHAGNYMQGPKGAAEKIFAETGIEYPVAKVAKIMGIYFDLFPEIRRWHWTLMYQVEKDGYLRNPFGYVHRFFRPFDYKKEGGKWKKEPGQDANRLIAFLPQSTAAGIIKEAILRLYFNRFEEAGQYMRLQIHDEIFCEVPEAEVDRVSPIVREEMEKSIPELRLPASYKMGECLNILTEDKKGYRWGEMK
jgi:uracil-DNA glycosylase family 4